MLLQTSIISRAWIYGLNQEKDVSICWRQVTNSCYYELQIVKKYDVGCTITPLSTKTRRSIYTRPTVNKVFDKLSRAVSVKHTSYNWRNGEATYLVLFTGYCSFISVCFSFFVICILCILISGFIVKD